MYRLEEKYTMAEKFTLSEKFRLTEASADDYEEGGPMSDLNLDTVIDTLKKHLADTPANPFSKDKLESRVKKNSALWAAIEAAGLAYDKAITQNQKAQARQAMNDYIKVLTGEGATSTPNTNRYPDQASQIEKLQKSLSVPLDDASFNRVSAEFDKFRRLTDDILKKDRGSASDAAYAKAVTDYEKVRQELNGKLTNPESLKKALEGHDDLKQKVAQYIQRVNLAYPATLFNGDASANLSTAAKTLNDLTIQLTGLSKEFSTNFNSITGLGSDTTNSDGEGSKKPTTPEEWHAYIFKDADMKERPQRLGEFCQDRWGANAEAIVDLGAALVVQLDKLGFDEKKNVFLQYLDKMSKKFEGTLASVLEKSCYSALHNMYANEELKAADIRCDDTRLGNDNYLLSKGLWDAGRLAKDRFTYYLDCQSTLLENSGKTIKADQLQGLSDSIQSLVYGILGITSAQDVTLSRELIIKWLYNGGNVRDLEELKDSIEAVFENISRSKANITTDEGIAALLKRFGITDASNIDSAAELANILLTSYPVSDKTYEALKKDLENSALQGKMKDCTQDQLHAFRLKYRDTFESGKWGEDMVSKTIKALKALTEPATA